MKPEKENVRAGVAQLPLRFSIADLTCLTLGIGVAFALLSNELKGSLEFDPPALTIYVFVSSTILGLLLTAVPIVLRQLFLSRSLRLAAGEVIWVCNLCLLPLGLLGIAVGVLHIGVLILLLVGIQFSLNISSMVVLYRRWSSPVKLSLPWTDTFGCVLSLSFGAHLLIGVLLNILAPF